MHEIMHEGDGNDVGMGLEREYILYMYMRMNSLIQNSQIGVFDRRSIFRAFQARMRVLPDAETIFEANRMVREIYPEDREFMAFELVWIQQSYSYI